MQSDLEHAILLSRYEFYAPHLSDDYALHARAGLIFFALLIFSHYKLNQVH